MNMDPFRNDFTDVLNTPPVASAAISPINTPESNSSNVYSGQSKNSKHPFLMKNPNYAKSPYFHIIYPFSTDCSFIIISN